MASITERRHKTGSTFFFAQIVRRSASYTESRSFPTRRAAEAWAKKREREVDAMIARGETPKTVKQATATLGDAIDKYVTQSVAEIGKTKEQVLRTIRNEYAICNKACDKVTSADLVTFAQEVAARPGVSSASTVGNYLSHLAAVFKHAPVLWGYPLDRQAMSDAIFSIKHVGIASRSNERSRRPTLEELDKIMTYFEQASEADRRCIPMHRVVAFALFSTRRQEELTRITWEDYDGDAQRVWVRKMKNPGVKGGVDTLVSLPDPCVALIEKQPRKKAQIFPYNPDTISRRFTDACKLLGIDDLHFHDLRREGTSRLAEMGWTVPQLATVTGHKSWQSLERYTHVRQIGDKYAGWSWIDKLTA